MSKETGMPDWKKERIEMTRLLWKHALEPIMTFSELVRGYDAGKGVEFSPQQLSDVLRLLVLGAYTEPQIHSITGGSLPWVSGADLEIITRDWNADKGPE